MDDYARAMRAAARCQRVLKTRRRTPILIDGPCPLMGENLPRDTGLEIEDVELARQTPERVMDIRPMMWVDPGNVLAAYDLTGGLGTITTLEQCEQSMGRAHRYYHEGQPFLA